MGSAGRPPADDVLTPSEWEVVHMVRHGMTNRRIAIQRGTSLDAVKFHLENIRAKLDLPSRASMRSWAGIPRHSLEASSMTTTGTSVALGALGQVSYTVKSLEPVVSFLKDTLGMTHLFTAGDLAFFDCNGTRLMVDALPEAQGNGNSVLYFRVEDIHGSVATLRARGVAFEGEPHMIHRHPDGTEEWMTFFRDPEGNMLSLMSQVKP
jgi:DNA-binding CsgD family transcriptional regulator/catechol 2,3-dioxygenase-like lactoylglutathione lyase family enzyme